MLFVKFPMNWLNTNTGQVDFYIFWSIFRCKFIYQLLPSHKWRSLFPPEKVTDKTAKKAEEPGTHCVSLCVSIFFEGKRPRGTYECPDSQGGWNGPEWLNLGASNFDSTFQSTDVLGETSNIFHVHHENWGNDPIWRALVQPPTSKLNQLWMWNGWILSDFSVHWVAFWFNFQKGLEIRKQNSAGFVVLSLEHQ